MRRPVTDLFPGDYRSIFSGVGTELVQVRPYEPGDDVRLIDPSATARRGEPHIRVHVAEKALTIWMVLDVSPSMAFGTADRLKADVAEGIVFVLGHLSPGAATASAQPPSEIAIRRHCSPGAAGMGRTGS